MASRIEDYAVIGNCETVALVETLYQAQPFNMFRAENYDLWKDIELTLDPKDKFKTAPGTTSGTPSSTTTPAPSK